MDPGTATVNRMSDSPLFKRLLELSRGWDPELMKFFEECVHQVELHGDININFSEVAVSVQNSRRINKIEKSNSKIINKILDLVRMDLRMRPPRSHYMDKTLPIHNDQKEEAFRLYWRMSNYGIHQYRSSLLDDTSDKKKQTRHDDTMFDEDSEEEHPPGTSLPNVIHKVYGIDSENQQSEELLERFPRDQMSRPEENRVDVEEVGGLESPNQEERENKRKWTEFTEILSNYKVTEFLIINHPRPKRGFGFDEELSGYEDEEERYKKKLKIEVKKHLNEFLLRDARHDFYPDFHGFNVEKASCYCNE